MRYLLSALGLAALLAIAACGDGDSDTTGDPAVDIQGRTGPASDITTSIAIEAPPGAVGEETSAGITADAVAEPGLGAWEIDVTYDPSIVSVSACESEAGQTVCNPEYDSDTIRIVGATGHGLLGDIVLARIDFTCDAEGVSPLDVTVALLADATIGDPRLMDPTVTDGEVVCGDAGPAETPAD